MRLVSLDGRHPLHRLTALDQRIGERVRALRLLNGMSQQELSDRLGVTCQQVQKYESGAASISVRRLIRISEIMHISVGHLIGTKLDASEQAIPDLSHAIPEAVDLVTMFRSITDPTARRILIDMAGILPAYST